MTNLDSILKSRDITLPTTVCQVRAMVFPVVMYGCESWTIKKDAGGEGLVAKSCLTLVTPWTGACQARLSMGFSRQEYWRGLPFPSPGDIPDPGIEPRSPALQAESLPTELQGKSQKDESQRIDNFELWCWRRLLRIPWTAKRLNQSILKEISPDYSLEGLMLKL